MCIGAHSFKKQFKLVFNNSPEARANRSFAKGTMMRGGIISKRIGIIDILR